MDAMLFRSPPLGAVPVVDQLSPPPEINDKLPSSDASSLNSPVCSDADGADGVAKSEAAAAEARWRRACSADGRCGEGGGGDDIKKYDERRR